MKNHYQKHLTLSDRTYIEQELQQGSSFTSIANIPGKDPATISKEIKRHRDYLKPDGFTGKCRSCMHYGECTERHVCGNDKCKYACRYCDKKNPIYHCVFYLPWNFRPETLTCLAVSVIRNERKSQNHARILTQNRYIAINEPMCSTVILMSPIKKDGLKRIMSTSAM